MKTGLLFVAAIALAAYVARDKKRVAEVKEKKQAPGKRVRDVGTLVPAFGDRIVKLVERMRARGYDAVVWETLRSRERAEKLAEAGAGIVDSMHCYGLAADIISEGKAWGAPVEFWAALGEEAERLGLTWGGRFSRRDMPHVQAVAPREQQAFRAMDAEQRQRVLETRFA